MLQFQTQAFAVNGFEEFGGVANLGLDLPDDVWEVVERSVPMGGDVAELLTPVHEFTALSIKV